jgi:hypothetical protein
MVHISLFLIVTLDGFFEALASGLHAKAVAETPLFVKTPIYLLSVKLNFLQVACQNTLILQLLFMWIELFQTIQYGNFVEQEKSVRRYAIVRTCCMVGIFTLNFLTLFLPVQINGSVEALYVWITFIPLGCFMVPILVMAIIRWKMLYNVMRECLRSHTRNGDRFVDLTKATCFAINSYFWDNFFAGYTQGQIAKPDVVFYIFISLLPNTFLPTAIIWFFTPLRKRQYKEDRELSGTTIPGVANNSSGTKEISGSVRVSDSRAGSATATTGDLRGTSASHDGSSSVYDEELNETGTGTVVVFEKGTDATMV